MSQPRNDSEARGGGSGNGPSRSGSRNSTRPAQDSTNSRPTSSNSRRSHGSRRSRRSSQSVGPTLYDTATDAETVTNFTDVEAPSYDSSPLRPGSRISRESSQGSEKGSYLKHEPLAQKEPGPSSRSRRGGRGRGSRSSSVASSDVSDAVPESSVAGLSSAGPSSGGGRRRRRRRGRTEGEPLPVLDEDAAGTSRHFFRLLVFSMCC